MWTLTAKTAATDEAVHYDGYECYDDDNSGDDAKDDDCNEDDVVGENVVDLPFQNSLSQS